MEIIGAIFEFLAGSKFVADFFELAQWISRVKATQQEDIADGHVHKSC